ncbi:uncharacterized protein PITG_15702 [Phytophthora infestans T30-4]|uniref:RxLR effector protein n=2 Tax=Phytophthora infestans TaxID=4787 RepID=D0NSD1_PHYIT|nr:uncharacterized protein PITG_15702 [Phytophthora infestans T30-4]EEY64476.1 hypothetical protein PITG_15702 [Phytophthora infestans T30-4]KAF4040247.1 hypothetical protein GN244_ATG07434 [Phytophthora infestans]KAF4131778.1 hypothetical protein GN958_ATG19035 [Phytophthora infestans]|eukprot:XP_002897979.1 hypothetical protein PITG_15702 [Phytophthora infestans T30-4]
MRGCYVLPMVVALLFAGIEDAHAKLLPSDAVLAIGDSDLMKVGVLKLFLRSHEAVEEDVDQEERNVGAAKKLLNLDELDDALLSHKILKIMLKKWEAAPAENVQAVMKKLETQKYNKYNEIAKAWRNRQQDKVVSGFPVSYVGLDDLLNPETLSKALKNANGDMEYFTKLMAASDENRKAAVKILAADSEYKSLVRGLEYDLL